MELPFNWKVIPAHFLEGCQIEHVKFPPGLREIRESALSCRELKEITLPKTLKKIGSGAFRGCFYLERIVIPQGVTEIGDSAFEGCNSLVQLSIPNKVKTIGDFAFSNCPYLSRITVPRSVESMYFRAFYQYTSQSRYVISYTTNPDGSFETKYNYSAPRTITFLNPNIQFLDDPEVLKPDYVPENWYQETIEYGDFLTLRGYTGSTAQAFAENPDHPCRFVSLDPSSGTVILPADGPQTMTFTGLLPNTVYNFYDLLGTGFTVNNLLYLSQGISDETGTLTVWYRPRTTDTNAAKYVRCSGSSAPDTPAVTTTAKPAAPVQTTTAKATTAPVKTTAATTSRPVSTVAGDANGDFVVDVSDAVLIARFCAEDSSVDISRQGIMNADVDHSGSPDPDDIVLILRLIAKLITSF